MAHSVGSLLLPAPAPGANEAVTDPCLDELAAFFQAVVEKYLSTAWSAVAPGEPIVRHVSKGFDPEEMNFSANQLPVLALWREGDASPTKLTDGNAESQSQINVLWVLPPSTQRKSASRFSVFSGFDKVMQLVVANERDTAYQHPDDIDVGQAALIREAAIAYGSNVMKRAGIDWWKLQRVVRVPVRIAAVNMDYRGYLAQWLIAESSESDPTQYGDYGATVVRFDLTDQSGEDAIVRQSAITPPTSP